MIFYVIYNQVCFVNKQANRVWGILRDHTYRPDVTVMDDRA